MKANLFLWLVYICIVIEGPIIKGVAWDPINWFNPAILLRLSQTKTGFQRHICRGLFYDQMSRGEKLSFVELILVEHHCLNLIS